MPRAIELTLEELQPGDIITVLDYPVFDGEGETVDGENLHRAIVDSVSPYNVLVELGGETYELEFDTIRSHDVAVRLEGRSEEARKKYLERDRGNNYLG
jgi:hypothetical protein